MSQEEKPWFNHSQMIANIMSARMKELGMTQKIRECLGYSFSTNE